MSADRLKIAQDSTRKSSRYWSWRAWIEGSPDELDGIDEVVWILHPTFTNPIRSIKSRETKFRLDTSGWGEFKLRAEVHPKSGPVQRMSHWVKLSDTDEQGEEHDIRVTSVPSGSSSPGRQSVFISYTKDSASLVRMMVDALKQRNVDALIDEDVPSSVDFRSWMKEKIYSSNAMVAVISNSTGVWQDSEIKTAVEAGVPLIPVAVNQPESPISQMLEGYETIVLKSSPDTIQRDAADLADRIVGSIASSGDSL
jgi:hypothetical protein